MDREDLKKLREERPETLLEEIKRRQDDRPRPMAEELRKLREEMHPNVREEMQRLAREAQEYRPGEVADIKERALAANRAMIEMTRVDTPRYDAALAQIAKRNQRHDMATELALANTADQIAGRLVARMVEFEKTLDTTQEVGFQLVTFGPSMVFHARNVGFHNPSLIVFQGVTEDGNEVELIQHISQINVLLTAVKRIEPDRDRMEYGFHALFAELFPTNSPTPAPGA